MSSVGTENALGNDDFIVGFFDEQVDGKWSKKLDDNPPIPLSDRAVSGRLSDVKIERVARGQVPKDSSYEPPKHGVVAERVSGKTSAVPVQEVLDVFRPETESWVYSPEFQFLSYL